MSGPGAALPLEAETVPEFGRVDLVHVSLPFVKPFSISSATWTGKETFLVRVEGAGKVGWGECVADPDPFYAPETTTSARHVVAEFLLPLVEPGLTFLELDSRFGRVRGNRMAKAALENALVDLAAKTKGVPLHELLGGARRRVPSGISIGLQESPAALVHEVEEAVARGYHRVKVKVKKGKDVDYVAEVLAGD